jgi:ribosomal-protein-alanine N-acetyltransferase
MPLGIRALADADVARISDWLSRSEPWRTLGTPAAQWPEYLRSAIADPAREADVVALDGEPCGLAVVRRHVLLGDYLELLAVAPASRRQGIGRMLLDHVERRAFGRTRNLYLCVSDFNLDARVFYRGAGYGEVGVLDDLVVQGRAEVLMRKTVGPVRRTGGDS